MTPEDAIKWLGSLRNDLGNPHYECLWPYAQALDEIVELLEKLEDLEKKYASLLNERISELIKENDKLNFEMNQAISERSILTTDRR